MIIMLMQNFSYLILFRKKQHLITYKDIHL
nr:MAG TPA: hypothetical protein [Bacteriophage sp.]